MTVNFGVGSKKDLTKEEIIFPTCLKFEAAFFFHNFWPNACKWWKSNYK
jgi:hypothetical protein